MPITIQLPEGLLSRDEEAVVVSGLTEAILEINGVSTNPDARKNLIVAVTTVPPDRLFAAGKREPWINVTLRVPVFSLDTLEKQRLFVTSMTDIIDKVTGGKLPRERIYINMIWGDGFWGIGGSTFSNLELIKALIAAGG